MNDHRYSQETCQPPPRCLRALGEREQVCERDCSKGFSALDAYDNAIVSRHQRQKLGGSCWTAAHAVAPAPQQPVPSPSAPAMEQQQRQMTGQESQQQCDAYGFPLAPLTVEQEAARSRCASYETRRAAKWGRLKGVLPPPRVLKRYCRKVRSDG